MKELRQYIADYMSEAERQKAAALARGDVKIVTEIRGALTALKDILAEADRQSGYWSRDLPNEQGVWWWWNDDEDSAPLHVSIMYSGSDGSYFAPAGQYGWNRYQPVKEMGGWWMRLREPALPNTEVAGPDQAQ